MTVTLTSPYRIGLVVGTGVTISAPAVPAITTDDIYNPDAPTQTLTQLLNGISAAKLVGSAIIDGTTVANIPIFTVPTGKILIPTDVVFALTNATGSGNLPAINLGFSGAFREYIDSTIGTTYALSAGAFFAPGTGYVPTDVLTLVGGTSSTTSQVTLTSTLLVSTAINAIGSGYAPNDTITLAGGVSSPKAVLTVATTKLASVSLNAPGTVYAPADTITLAGGTAATKAIVTVNTVSLASATINAGGTGYGNTSTFNVTVAGGTGSPQAVVNVTTNSGGVITTINSITTPGSYTVLPSLTANAVTGGSGTGATLNLTFGILTFTISTAGSYTVNSATFTQFSTTGTGTGATFNNGLFGLNTITVQAGGTYTTNAASFTQFSTSGSGTGATFNTTAYGAQGFTVSRAGSYTVLPANHVATTGGTGTGATFDATWSVLASLVNMTTTGQLLTVNDLASTAQSNNLRYMTAATVLTARVAFGSTYTAYTMRCFVFGFVTNAP